MPKKSPTRDLRRLRRMASYLDAQLVKILRDGRPCFNPDGTPVLDESGKQIMRPPSAADLNAAARRLQACDIKVESTPQSVREQIQTNLALAVERGAAPPDARYGPGSLLQGQELPESTSPTPPPLRKPTRYEPPPVPEGQESEHFQSPRLAPHPAPPTVMQENAALKRRLEELAAKAGG